ncbi:MAG: hypothetical protein ACI80K_000011 [Paracoccaceae bacterium]|jgi:hypothetical protein
MGSSGVPPDAYSQGSGNGLDDAVPRDPEANDLVWKAYRAARKAAAAA